MPYGPGASKYWAIAVNQAKKMGYKSFKMTDAGHHVAGKIAEEMEMHDKRVSFRKKHGKKK